MKRCVYLLVCMIYHLSGIKSMQEKLKQMPFEQDFLPVPFWEDCSLLDLECLELHSGTYSKHVLHVSKTFPKSVEGCRDDSTKTTKTR